MRFLGRKRQKINTTTNSSETFWVELAECMVRRVNAREKFRMKESLRQCIRPLGGEFSPGLDEIRRVPVLRKHAGLVWAISASRFQVRRFDCSFIFTYPVQTSVGRTCCCWLLSLLILSVPRVLLDSPGPSRALPTRSAPVCVLLPRSIRFVAPWSQARSSRRPSRFGLSSIATRPRVLHESGSCAGKSCRAC